MLANSDGLVFFRAILERQYDGGKGRSWEAGLAKLMSYLLDQHVEVLGYLWCKTCLFQSLRQSKTKQRHRCDGAQFRGILLAIAVLSRGCHTIRFEDSEDLVSWNYELASALDGYVVRLQ